MFFTWYYQGHLVTLKHIYIYFVYAILCSELEWNDNQMFGGYIKLRVGCKCEIKKQKVVEYSHHSKEQLLPLSNNLMSWVFTNVFFLKKFSNHLYLWYYSLVESQMINRWAKLWFHLPSVEVGSVGAQVWIATNVSRYTCET